MLDLRLPEVGKILAGKYEMLRPLGQGGMGVVYEALHIRLNQRVALKFLRPEHLASVEFVKRFEREGRHASVLKSDFVARVFDVDVTPDGIPYIVTECLEGHDLARELRKRNTLPVEEAVRYVIEACVAVDEAHRHGIIHRDLKPANLFLVGGGERRSVKVLDFGVSKSKEEDQYELTTTGMVIGSPRYMSPEQVGAARTVDRRADIWALGVILYRALSGQYPFEADSVIGLVLATTSQSARPLQEAAPSVPPGLAVVVMRALRKDPEERYSTAGELARALAPFSDGAFDVLEPALEALALVPMEPLPSRNRVPVRDGSAESASGAAVVEDRPSGVGPPEDGDSAAGSAGDLPSTRVDGTSPAVNETPRRFRSVMLWTVTVTVLVVSALVGASVWSKSNARSRSIVVNRPVEAPSSTATVAAAAVAAPPAPTPAPTPAPAPAPAASAEVGRRDASTPSTRLSGGAPTVEPRSTAPPHNNSASTPVPSATNRKPIYL
jgi:serine/threonine protein kinase